MPSYYTLGRSGLRVSRLALGTMTFGNETGWGTGEASARSIFELYLERGGNFLDTANLYTGGDSERWVGRFVREAGVRDRMVVATKFTFNPEPGNPNAGGNGRKNIYASLESSLRRLEMDYVDLYILHAWDRFTPAEEVVQTLTELVRSGKVRYVGLSDVPAWYAARIQTIAHLRGLEPFCSVQLEYSLVERSIEAEFVSMSKEIGMDITVWSPLASGLLSGKYKPLEHPEARYGEGRLEKLKNSPNPAFQKFSERNWGIVAELERVANELGKPMAAVALNWVANRPGVGSVILGATRREQLADNLSALDFSIPAELGKRLDDASRPPTLFPYAFFEDEIQSRITGGVKVNA